MINEFEAADNMLYGPLPTSRWNTWNNVTRIRFQANQLSGSIPDSRANMSWSIKILELWNNNFSWPIPSWLTTFNQMQITSSNGDLPGLQLWMNCFDIYNIDPILSDYLDIYGTYITSPFPITETMRRDIQKPCFDVDISMSTDNDIAQAGDTITYTIDYVINNSINGPNNANISIIFPNGMTFATGSMMPTSIWSWSIEVYGEDWDICIDHMRNGMGVYVNWLNDLGMMIFWESFEDLIVYFILDDLLDEGDITQEEYDDYVAHPWDFFVDVFLPMAWWFMNFVQNELGIDIIEDFTGIEQCGMSISWTKINFDLGQLAPDSNGTIEIQMVVWMMGSHQSNFILYAIFGNTRWNTPIYTFSNPINLNFLNPPNASRWSSSVHIQTDQERWLCPDGDFSDSYYDQDCGTPSIQHDSPEIIEEQKDIFLINNKSAFTQRVEHIRNSMQCTLSTELIEAYVFAYDIGITTIWDICAADMHWPLLRKHLAKMMTTYWTKTLNLSIDRNKICNFPDISWESTEMQFFARTACQLGKMWLKRDGSVHEVFNPNDIVFRSIFSVAFSRLLWWGKYNTHLTDSRTWYESHMEALRKNNIMKVLDPYIVETRWFVMLMMMRAYQHTQNQ
jgi:uncharacterized repeat protein (TIGR01451 family)